MGTDASIDFSNRALRKLIIPLVIEQLLAITVGLADSLMVARVGMAAGSAVSLVDTVNILLINSFAALATGGAVIAGQYLGRRETEKANRSAWQLLLFMGECSLVITAILYLLRGFILNVVFGAIEPDVAAYANTYFLIVEASTFFLAIYNAGAALFRVMGNSKTAMWVSLIMNLVNVVGNAILIYLFHRGVEGVAIPTLISRIVAAVLIVVLLLRPGLPLRLERPFRFRHDKQMIRNILHVGVPTGIEGGMFQLGKILLLSVVAGFGTASVAANAIGNSIANFQVLAPQSIGLGIVTVVSRCVGAGDFEKARYYTKKLMVWSYVSMIVSVAIIFVCTPGLLWLYNYSAEATYYAKIILWFHGGAGSLIWPIAFVLPQAIRAAGDTRFTMTVSTASMWAFRVILGVVMATTLGLGVLGTWYAMFVDWAVRSIFFGIRYRGHRWEAMGLKE